MAVEIKREFKATITFELRSEEELRALLACLNHTDSDNCKHANNLNVGVDAVSAMSERLYKEVFDPAYTALRGI